MQPSPAALSRQRIVKNKGVGVTRAPLSHIANSQRLPLPCAEQYAVDPCDEPSRWRAAVRSQSTLGPPPSSADY
eukprot:1194786-Prorocentrum_minimum.AAC.3